MVHAGGDDKAVQKPGHTSIIIEESIDPISTDWLPQSKGSHTNAHSCIHTDGSAHRLTEVCVATHVCALATCTHLATLRNITRLPFLNFPRIHGWITSVRMCGMVCVCMAAEQYS